MGTCQLMQLRWGSGAADSPEAAGRLCEALRAAGVVVRVGGTVFLRPDEVAETILKVCCLSNPSWMYGLSYESYAHTVWLPC